MFESLDVDALVLAEASCPPATWVSALFAADRRLLHHLSQHHMRPTSGSLLPRVFRKAVLLPAFELIPDDVPGIAVAQDHAIIWDAVARRARSVEIVSEAVLHEEMTTVRQLWRKYFSWGVSLPTLFDVAPEYGRLTRRAMRGRLHRGDAPFRDYVRSLALLSMKSMPYSAGFLYGRIQRSSAVHRRAPR
jgi:hypothetical protein